MLVDLSLGVVADHAGVDEAAEIEPFGSEHGHFECELPGVAIALVGTDRKDVEVKRGEMADGY